MWYYYNEGKKNSWWAPCLEILDYRFNGVEERIDDLEFRLFA